MKKSFIIAVLVTLVSITASAFAQTPDWSNFNGGQLILNFKAEPISLGKGWESIAKGMVFSMPTQGFTQLWGYFGAQKGVVSVYAGPAYNWQAGDHVFAGVTIDIPFGNYVWETEVDNVFNKDPEQYLWTGVDANCTVLGTHAFWFGPQVEAIRTSKTCAQIGARIGLDRFQLGGYFGDRGWNARLSITVPIK